MKTIITHQMLAWKMRLVSSISLSILGFGLKIIKQSPISNSKMADTEYSLQIDQSQPMLARLSFEVGQFTGDTV